MNIQTPILDDTLTFKHFLFKNPWYKFLLCLSTAVVIIQFSVFKYYYPYAGFINGDSYVYLESAFWNLDINTYMIGYSKFLRLFSVFSHSDTALTLFQYILIQSGAIFLVFTMIFFFRPLKFIEITLVSFIVLNPLFLYIANYVSSDGFFLGLSLYWFASLFWIIYKPSAKIIFLSIVLLFVAFTVRYNALLYPFIMTLAILLSKLTLHKKVISIAASFLVCGYFILFTAYHYKQLTGTWQYSPFSGWQLANNAMYAYRYVESTERKPVPDKYKRLDNMVCKYFDSHKDVNKYPEESMLASTAYMWTPSMPLWEYMNSKFNNDSTSSRLKKWASMAPLYKDYGRLLIFRYPWHFLRYFIWPNANKYYAPPVEFLESYNMNRDTVANVAQGWFKYKSNKVKTTSGDFKIEILNYYPIFTGMINLVFVGCFVCSLFVYELKKNKNVRNGITLVLIFWIFNAGFTIFASSAALRFQAFPIILITVFTIFFINWLILFTRDEKKTPTPNFNLNNSNAIPLTNNTYE